MMILHAYVYCIAMFILETILVGTFSFGQIELMNTISIYRQIGKNDLIIFPNLENLIIIYSVHTIFQDISKFSRHSMVAVVFAHRVPILNVSKKFALRLLREQIVPLTVGDDI